jgi:hypothetical protein
MSWLQADGWRGERGRLHEFWTLGARGMRARELTSSE